MDDSGNTFSWQIFIAGVLACLILFLLGTLWWNRNEEPEKVATESIIVDEEDDETPPMATIEPDDLVEPDEVEATPKLVREATSEPTPEPTPAPTPEPTPEPIPSPTPAPDPIGCTFVDGNRPMVGDKYILRCQDGTLFLAHGEYVGGGVFSFHDFEPHAP